MSARLRIRCQAAVWAVLMAAAAPASAQLGAPVTGQVGTAGVSGAFITWEGDPGDPGHEMEATALGGFTLLAALTPGGAVVASLSLPWPPPTPRLPAFIVPNAPPGTYYVVVLKGLTLSTALVPPSAWRLLVVPGPCTTAPLAPVGLTGFQGGNIVTVRWQDAPGSCPAAGYELHAGYSPGASDAGVFQFAGNAYIGPAPPNTYYLRVRARNAYGTSGFSTEIVFTVNPTSCIGPGAPRALSASVQNGLVTLTWLPPQDPGTLPIAAYGLVAGTFPGGSNAANLTLIGTPTSFQTTAPSGTYFVRVSALNGCGGTSVFGAPSNEAVVVVP